MKRQHTIILLLSLTFLVSISVYQRVLAADGIPPAEVPSCEPDAVPPYSPSSTASSRSQTTLKPALRQLAEGQDFWIGAATDAWLWQSDPTYQKLLASQFNMIATENALKWEVVHPQPDSYDFSAGDTILDFARANQMAVYGHALAWGLQLPPWITEGDYTREQWMELLCRHIKTVVGHYRGHIYAWDVVNEAVSDEGPLYENHWLRVIGPEYIPLAFKWAHEADPDAILVYNDHGGEGLNAKSQAIYDLVKGLVEQGIPIHGVGMQMHVWLDGPPTPQELSANMKRLAALGLQTHITEMDIRTQYSTASMPQKLGLQSRMYRQAFTACLYQPRCKVFVTWGLSDRYSWIPGYTGKPDAPLLFDEASKPKPAYFAIRKTLSDRQASLACLYPSRYPSAECAESSTLPNRHDMDHLHAPAK